MASGDLTASSALRIEGSSNIKAAIDSLNLAAATDFIMVVPIPGRDQCWTVFKVEREA